MAGFSFHCWQLLDYLTDDSLVVEVWGTQKDEGFKSGTAAGASDKNKLTTKDLMSRERSGLGMTGAGGAAAAASPSKVSALSVCAEWWCECQSLVVLGLLGGKAQLKSWLQ